MKIKYILLFLIIFIFTACKKDVEEEIIRPVKIQEINSIQDGSFNIDFPAQISPTQKTVLAFKYAGKIKSINFESGNFVKKGQVIATIDDSDYKVNLEAFSKKYEAAKAVAQNAEVQFSRAEKLYKGGALAKKDYDNAVMQKNVAISTFKEASAGLENARNTLNDTKIIAPYDGYIDKKIVEAGTVIPEGGPVISFISNEITDISVNASLKDLENIKKNEKFLSGQTGTVTISVKNNGNQEILIPLDALFEDNGSNVYLFKNGIAVKTAVEIGELRETDKISIVKGLKSGDKVIVAGVSKLADGEKVKILGGTQ